VPEFDLQFFHLGLHKQGHQRFDLPLLNSSQVLGKEGWDSTSVGGPSSPHFRGDRVRRMLAGFFFFCGTEV
jgi:hypothetical protein